MKGGSIASPRGDEGKMLLKMMREKAVGSTPLLTADYVARVRKMSSALYARLVHLYMSILVNIPYIHIHVGFGVHGSSGGGYMVEVTHRKADKYIELQVSDTHAYVGDKIPGMTSIDVDVGNVKKVRYAGDFGEPHIAMIHTFLETAFENMFPFPLEGDTCLIKLDAIDAENKSIDFVALLKAWNVSWLVPEGDPSKYRIDFNALLASPKVRPSTPLLKTPVAIRPSPQRLLLRTPTSTPTPKHTPSPTIITGPRGTNPLLPVFTATSKSLIILGRKRKIYVINGIEHVMYQKNMIPLAQAQNMEQALNRAMVAA
jgi:hypothetical protein